jgi:hypothetical protein
VEFNVDFAGTCPETSQTVAACPTSNTIGTCATFSTGWNVKYYWYLMTGQDGAAASAALSKACTTDLAGIWSAGTATGSSKPAPFALKSNINITATSATVGTQITFNPTDIGKPGAVYVTGWVPLTGLSALGISGSDAALIITRTADDPGIVGAGNLHVSQGALAETDTSSFVLVQLTASGWQMVVNGQLVPYASGVLGDQLAAQSILNNADSSKLNGTQLCLGYGASSSEMVASGRMLPVATIPGATSTGSCNVADNTYTGLFWNANESGWGMSVTQHGSMIFSAWYVYDSAGKPTWYVLPSCPLNGKTCTSDIYAVVGGAPFASKWNGASIAAGKAGSGTLTFADNDNATLNYTLNGTAGTRTITRQPIAIGTTPPPIDYSSLWWNASESGWGVAITQQYAVIFATMFTYDAGGNAIWYVAPNCPVLGTACSSTLYQVAGGSAPTATWKGGIVATPVGSVSFSFTDSSIGTMNVTINGVTTSKAIARQPF